MKYIFDFDDVLFYTSKQCGHPLFKNYQFSVIEKAGIPMDAILKYYETERLNQFSLKKMLQHFSLPESLYQEILEKSKNFVNTEMLALVKKLGKSHCSILTYGNTEFQNDKVKSSGVGPLFNSIISVPGSKKEAIENICSIYIDEPVFFIDDSVRHFENLDTKKHLNLRIIHYAGQKLDNSTFLL